MRRAGAEVVARGVLPSRACMSVALPLAGLLSAAALVHLAPPPLAVTWSFAHLHRHPAFPVAAVVLLIALPPLAAWWWDRPESRRALRPMRWWSVAAACAALAAGMLLVVRLGGGPVPVAIDSWWLVETVRRGGTAARWHLLVEGLKPLARPFGGDRAAAEALVRSLNAVLGAVALTALVGAARRLARTRGEAVAIASLACSPMGVAQLVPGYLDVYPAALSLLAVYLWCALRTTAGDGHPAWPLGLAALGPFVYLGLLLLAPSALVLAVLEMHRSRDWRRLALAAGGAVLVAGVATIPGFGRPFAWRAWLAAVEAESGREMGLSATSSLLPPADLFSVTHVVEVAHTLFLLDPVGWLLLAVPGVAVAVGRWREPWHPAVPLLLSVLGPYLAYVATMDPLLGAFADWDLFSFQTAATALLAAWAFVVWGRDCPKAFGLLFGLALATAGVHLLARFNALDVEARRHIEESPLHVIVPGLPTLSRAPQ